MDAGICPSDPSPLTIEILGPVVESDAAGNQRLRAFGEKPTSTSMDNGKTKNGHSILLRLDYNGFKVLFGGDLNRSSETFLMLHYGNRGAVPPPLAGRHPLLKKVDNVATIKAAAKRFSVDLMKSCHHGSSDVTEEFLDATSASSFVISSGDNESHVHPRPDLLGLLGKYGRGKRPLLLSTELARSTREREDQSLGRKLDRLDSQIESELLKRDKGDRDKLKKLRAERRDIRDDLLKRNVGVYGAINLRTDGKRAVIAFRKESGSPTSRWFYYELVKGDDGEFKPIPGAGH